MKTPRTPRDKESESDPRPGRAGGLRIAETRLLGSLAALAALGAVILTGFWVASLVREPSTTPDAGGRPPASPPIAGEARGEGSKPREREPVAETSEVFASRDPFGSLAPGGGGSAGRGSGGGSSRPSWARAVELVAARRSGAQVRIDERSFTVDEGRRFAQHFRLLYTSSDCAAILFGDDQFTICEGERILK